MWLWAGLLRTRQAASTGTVWKEFKEAALKRREVGSGYSVHRCVVLKVWSMEPWESQGLFRGSMRSKLLS